MCFQNILHFKNEIIKEDISKLPYKLPGNHLAYFWRKLFLLQNDLVLGILLKYFQYCLKLVFLLETPEGHSF